MSSIWCLGDEVGSCEKNIYPEVHVIGKKYQISPFSEVVAFFFSFSGFWLFGRFTFGILPLWKIKFRIFVSGF